MKVFLDANFLIAAGLTPDGDYQEVLAARLDEYVTSEHLLAEVTRNVERLGRNPKPFVENLRGFVRVTDKFDLLPVGLPLTGSGDRQALAEAMGSECELFVTSDTDFSALFGQRIGGVLVEKSRTYAGRILSRLEKDAK